MLQPRTLCLIAALLLGVGMARGQHEGTSIEGHVVSWKYQAPNLHLLLATPGGSLDANVQAPDVAGVTAQLNGARLRLIGMSEGTGRTLLVPDLKQVQVLEAGTADIFEAPQTSISDVMKRKVERGRRWRIRGVYAARTEPHKIIVTGPDGAMQCHLLPPRTETEPDTLYGDPGPWPDFKPGDVVEVVGSVIDGPTPQGLTWCHVRVVGHEAPPEPEPMDLETLRSLRNDDRWAVVECTVCAWMQAGGVRTYAVADPRMNLAISVRETPQDSFPLDLHNARMRFTGISTSLTPTAQGTLMVVPSPSFVEITEAGHADPFAVSEHTAAEIAGNRAPLGRRVKTRGVLLGRKGNVIYVRGADGALAIGLQSPWYRPADTTGMRFADCGQQPEILVGDELEIMGTVIRNEKEMGMAPYDLVSANLRVIGGNKQHDPVGTTLAEVAQAGHTSDFVELRGRLIALQQSPAGGEWRSALLLEADGLLLPAVFQGHQITGFETLKEDDDVVVRGMVLRATPKDHRQLWLADTSEIRSMGLSPTVLRRRLWLWGGGTLAVIALLGGWIVVLRRNSRMIARNALELKAASEAARESEQRWKLLFEQSPLSVQMFAPDGQAKRFNQAWKNLFHLNDEQGLAFNVLKDPDLNASGAVNLIRRAFEGEVVNVPPVPFSVNTDPPETRWIGGVLYPVKNEAGQIMEVVTIHNDITEMKRAEEAMLAINHTLENRVEERTAELRQTQADLQRALELERDLGELKTRFVTMVSHEFRTPLGIIMSAVELLQHYSDRLPDDEKTRQLHEIQSSTKHMAGLMEQVLLLGRAEAGKLTCRPQALDLASFAERIIDETQSISSRRCPITLQPEGDLAGARVDEALLRHILGNLVGNAVKYSPDGAEVSLRIRREGPNAAFAIIDRGIGIPEKDRARLFEAFHRCSNVGDTPGTGLGLVIVKRCVDLHGGTINIDSEPGRGTTFTVRLPLFTFAGIPEL